MLNDKSKPWLSKAVPGVNDERNVEHESYPKDWCHTNKEDVIAGEKGSTVKYLVFNEFLTTREEVLENILRK